MKKIPVHLIVTLSVGANAAWADNTFSITNGTPHDNVQFMLVDSDSTITCNPTSNIGYITPDVRENQIRPFSVLVKMTDWVQIDNDYDGRMDEDPQNGIDDDKDGYIDEDGPEPGAFTTFFDCNGLDGELGLQIRDTEPKKGVISTQEWFVEMKKMPQSDLAFFTNSDHLFCSAQKTTEKNNSQGDQIIDCNYQHSDWIPLSQVNLTTMPENCIKQSQFELGGFDHSADTNRYCDISNAFEMDMDINGDGHFNSDLGETDQLIFSGACADTSKPNTTRSPQCELNRIIWSTVAPGKNVNSSAQVYISHTGNTRLQDETVSFQY